MVLQELTSAGHVGNLLVFSLAPIFVASPAASTLVIWSKGGICLYRVWGSGGSHRDANVPSCPHLYTLSLVFQKYTVLKNGRYSGHLGE